MGYPCYTVFKLTIRSTRTPRVHLNIA